MDAGGETDQRLTEPPSLTDMLQTNYASLHGASWTVALLAAYPYTRESTEQSDVSKGIVYSNHAGRSLKK